MEHAGQLKKRGGRELFSHERKSYADGAADRCAMAWGLGLEPRFSDSKSDVLPIRRPQIENRSWLGDQESNLDSQIQNLMSYQLDDPQKQRAPAGRCLPELFVQKADHRLPSSR
jgi:hypothetical protein